MAKSHAVCLCQMIRVTFTMLDVELSENCVYDHLSIFDGGDDRSSPIGVYCGIAKPQELIQSSGTTLFLSFVSDVEDGGQGFDINWMAVDDTGQ